MHTIQIDLFELGKALLITGFIIFAFVLGFYFGKKE